jgi:SPP1 gp7 family putative phage head morphogenesis protein
MPNLDALASDIADRVICEHCEAEVRAGLQTRILSAIGIKRRRRPIKPNWQARDRFLAPYEKRMKSTLRAIWKQERRDVLANMRRAPLPGKSMAEAVTKADTGIVDQWLYPGNKYKALLTAKSAAILSKLIGVSIVRADTMYALGVNFNLVNERALEWLRSYTPKLAGAVEAETLATLRANLIQGIEAGENMDTIRRRIQDTFDDMERWRAEMIARSETITAQERGNRETFKDAGFTQKVWLANPDACEICLELDGKVVGIDDPFFYDPKGYSDGQGPTRHPRCRCTASGWDESFSN